MSTIRPLSLLPIVLSLLCLCYTMSFIALCKGVRSLSHAATVCCTHSRPYLTVVASQRSLILSAHTVHREKRLYSPTILSSAASNGNDGGATVVSVCTQKIRDLLKPVQLSVTSANDDPNGSHVRLAAALLMSLMHLSM